jgi:hypothetical protein
VLLRVQRARAAAGPRSRRAWARQTARAAAGARQGADALKAHVQLHMCQARKLGRSSAALPQCHLLSRHPPHLRRTANACLRTPTQVRGPGAVAEWRRLQDFMRPYATAAPVIPATAIRSDPAVLLTTLMRYGGDVLASGGKSAQLVKPFSELIEGVVTDPFIKNWLDLLCFLLSGLPANGTIAAEVRLVGRFALCCCRLVSATMHSLVDMAACCLARCVAQRNIRPRAPEPSSQAEPVALLSASGTGSRLRRFAGGLHVQRVVQAQQHARIPARRLAGPAAGCTHIPNRDNGNVLTDV